jgi:hypothetical protein
MTDSLPVGRFVPDRELEAGNRQQEVIMLSSDEIIRTF